MTLTLRQNGDKRIGVKMVKKSQCNISLRFFFVSQDDYVI